MTFSSGESYILYKCTRARAYIIIYIIHGKTPIIRPISPINPIRRYRKGKKGKGKREKGRRKKSREQKRLKKGQDRYCLAGATQKSFPLQISLKRETLSKTAATYSPTLAVPSARSGLTSLFGMGRGGTPTL